MLKVQNLSFSYNDKKVFSNISIEINEQSCLILRGNSGVGKTTLLKILSGQMAPKSGKVLIDDEDIFAMSEKSRKLFRRKYISFLAQNTKLVDSISVIDNIVLPSIFQGCKEIDLLMDSARKWLSYVGLEGYENKMPQMLSGGEQRRVEIARVLSSDSKYLLMDEPSNSLDDKCVELFCELIRKTIADHKTLIISTHDERLFDLGTRTVLIESATVRSI